jgi:hypothetical protein
MNGIWGDSGVEGREGRMVGEVKGYRRPGSLTQRNVKEETIANDLFATYRWIRFPGRSP